MSWMYPFVIIDNIVKLRDRAYEPFFANHWLRKKLAKDSLAHSRPKFCKVCVGKCGVVDKIPLATNQVKAKVA